MKSNFEIPVLFIIFNRPDITRRVFEEIKRIKPKYLFVAADGPRDKKSSDIVECQKTRNILKSIDWDCQLKTLFREKNIGCGRGPSEARTWFFKYVGNHLGR